MDALFYWSGQQDLNLRPPHPQCGALPGCAMPRNLEFETKSSEVYLEETLLSPEIVLCVLKHEETLENLATSLNRQ